MKKRNVSSANQLDSISMLFVVELEDEGEKSWAQEMLEYYRREDEKKKGIIAQGTPDYLKNKCEVGFVRKFFNREIELNQ